MKPTLPQGMRDFGPRTIRKRRFIFDTIRSVFELYGFEPLETPAIENLDTLVGKYGDEGDKLIFKILNNGLDNPAKASEVKEEFNKLLEGKNSKTITERALRYDLTIPFARYVAMYHGQLNYPFKRYQMQPVWRADRPQKGRYREFYQCDADVVGSASLLNDIEFAHIYIEVFKRLHLDTVIKINNRKILTALAILCGDHNKMMAITIAIDKLDKIGIEKVREELMQRDIPADKIRVIENYMDIKGSNEEKITQLRKLFSGITIGEEGIKELEFILQFDESISDKLQLDFTLARGLNYYTGVIFEVIARGIEMGSIGGGGRYDDLTGLFDVPGIPGVGISFGVDRIFDAMEELKLFPEEVQGGTIVLFFNMGEEESKFAFSQMQLIRQQGISCELFHDNAKIDKQFKYADKKNIRYVVIIGSKEIAAKTFVVKDLSSGEQKEIQIDKIKDYFLQF